MISSGKSLFFFFALVTLGEAIKLQNYLNPDSSVVDPEVKASISERQGKFLAFYTTTVKSTTTSTSLISSMTQCYIADPAITVACMRKKKSIDSAPIEGMEQVDAGMISPSSPKVASKDEDLNQVDSSSSQESPYRAARFLDALFFSTSSVTVVETTTETTFTSTNSFSIAVCNPVGISVCSG